MNHETTTGQDALLDLLISTENVLVARVKEALMVFNVIDDNVWQASEQSSPVCGMLLSSSGIPSCVPTTASIAEVIEPVTVAEVTEAKTNEYKHNRILE